MKVLISGLNSYIGRRATSHLQTQDFQVFGIVRDIRLFRSRCSEPITATLDSVDLLLGGMECHSYRQDNLDFGIFFVQSPDFGDPLSLSVELTRLKNFVGILKRNLCARILFVARLIDKRYIQYVEDVLSEMDMHYTVILKNIAIGKDSLADRYFRHLLTRKMLFYDRDMAQVEFKPIYSLDVLRWIRTVDWQRLFVNQVVELGGIREMSLRELFYLYRQVYNVQNKGIPLPHKLYNLFNVNSKILHREDVAELRRVLHYEYPVDNSAWARLVPFSFTPIEEVILSDVYTKDGGLPTPVVLEK